MTTDWGRVAFSTEECIRRLESEARSIVVRFLTADGCSKEEIMPHPLPPTFHRLLLGDLGVYDANAPTITGMESISRDYAWHHQEPGGIVVYKEVVPPKKLRLCSLELAKRAVEAAKAGNGLEALALAIDDLISDGIEQVIADENQPD